MIDHEVRIICPAIEKAILNRFKTEPILLKKIPFSNHIKKNYQKNYSTYFQKAKDIKEIYLRGLPINNKNLFYQQNFEIEESFINLTRNLGRKINYKLVLHLPNPDIVSLKDFEKTFTNLKNIHAFELISSWHGNYSDSKKYDKFLSMISETKLPLNLEVDYIFRKSLNAPHNFFNIIKKFPDIEYWLPHLGCGIFLHQDKYLDILKKKPSFLTSTKDSILWMNLFKMKDFKNTKIKYATDHPFNSNSSLKIFLNWKKYKFKKK